MKTSCARTCLRPTAGHADRAKGLILTVKRAVDLEQELGLDHAAGLERARREDAGLENQVGAFDDLGEFHLERGTRLDPGGPQGDAHCGEGEKEAAGDQ